MEQFIITQGITDIVLGHLEASGLSDREWARSVGITHPMIGKFRTGTSMGIDTLERIVTKYPELKPAIADVFYKKGTAATNNDEAAVRAEAKRQREELRLLNKGRGHEYK